MDIRTNTAAIIGAIGTGSAVIVREYAEAAGFYVSLLCGLCTLVIILPKAVKTVRQIFSNSP